MNKDNRTQKNGFTLMEVLIASGILVSIFTVGLGIFTNLINSAYQFKAIIRTNQAGRYLIEEIGRQVRMADRITIIKNNNELIVESSEGKKDYFVSGGIFYIRINDSTSAKALTSITEVSVENLAVDGSDSTNIKEQPYVSLILTLKYQGEKSKIHSFQETFRTTISNQKY